MGEVLLEDPEQLLDVEDLLHPSLESLLNAYCDHLQAIGRRSHSDARGLFRLHVMEAWPETAAMPAKDVNLAPGASPGQVVINGSLTLNAGDTLSMELAGLDPATEYGNFVVEGNVVLNGATLAASRVTSFVPPNGASFTLIDNDDNDAVAETFAGLAEGATVVLSGIPFTISYQGGSVNNDVVLTIVTPTHVYVDDSWAGTPIGTTPATSDPPDPE